MIKRDDSEEIPDEVRFKAATELTNQELNYFIDYYHGDAINGKFLKGRKFSRNKMNELILERDRRFQKTVRL